MYKENIFLKIVTYGPLVFIPFLVGVVLLISIELYNENFKANLQKTKEHLFSIEQETLHKKIDQVSHLISYRKSLNKEKLESTTNISTEKMDRELFLSMEKIDEMDNKYIFILTLDGYILMNRTSPEVVGKNVIEVDNKKFLNIATKLLGVIKDRGDASLTYEWKNPLTGKIEEKYTYAKKIPGTDWIVGSGFYKSDIENKLSKIEMNMKEIFYSEVKNIIYYSLPVILFSLLISYYISRKLRKSFHIYELSISKKNTELKELNETLEQKVKTRTAQIEKIKDDYEILATTDALTDMDNRYSLMKKFEIEISRSQRYKTPLSIIMYDIDFFKNVNDTHGHSVGDSVLVALSNMIKNNLRSIDVIGRYGGEEFLILLPNTTLDEANKFAQRLREEVEEHTFDSVGNITISIGVVELKADEKLDEVFKRVDNLLYKSKDDGRNRVSFNPI